MTCNLSQYISIADALAELFRPHAEIVIHDIEDDTIFYIANPYSGRQLGDSSNLKIGAQNFDLEEDVIGPYEKVGTKGQSVRSITSVLKDDKGNPRGLMCINLDFSILESSLSVVRRFFNPMNEEPRPEILFRNEWLEVTLSAIRSYLKEQGQTKENLDVQGRKALLLHLDKKGLFYARKSAEQVAAYLGISRATIYKGLSEIRKKKKTSDILVGL
ncbi:PAS domain-containing protein [Desulfobacula sp.]|uniref:helix-turn-helix transcriptional regulator n=1 Tax=Desulfobacula sp. TaxID=2593537 RepID=UPI0026310D03|nr:PAS domain-containing protein [Desulfobacula sp.]